MVATCSTLFSTNYKWSTGKQSRTYGNNLTEINYEGNKMLHPWKVGLTKILATFLHIEVLFIKRSS